MGAVVDAEAAAGVDVADVVAVFAKVGDEADDASEGGGEGIDFADLRADVDGDSGCVEPLRFLCCAIEGASGFDVDDSATLRRLCYELLGNKGVSIETAPSTRQFLTEIIAREGRERIWPIL